MYYIYHIPGVKIGCSTNPNRRVFQQYKGNDWEILETHNDINIASKREIELQKQYGYNVDNTSYKQSYDFAKAGRLSHTKESYKKWNEGSLKWKKENPEKAREIAVLGGKKTGPKIAKRNVESGWISNLGKEMAEKNNQIQTCPYCNIVARGVGYHRWHGDNCKKKFNP